MAEVSVQIIDNSDLIEQATNEAIVKALEAMGLQAEGYAKMKCPVDTGNLRNSITHAVEGNSAYIGTNVEYAPYVEYGTQKTKAQPFLKPAVTDHANTPLQIWSVVQQRLHKPEECCMITMITF